MLVKLEVEKVHIYMSNCVFKIYYTTIKTTLDHNASRSHVRCSQRRSYLNGNNGIRLTQISLISLTYTIPRYWTLQHCYQSATHFLGNDLM